VGAALECKRPLILICGVGGQGKRALVRKGLSLFPSTTNTTVTTWLDGPSALELTNSVTAAAKKLGVAMLDPEDKFRRLTLAPPVLLKAIGAELKGCSDPPKSWLVVIVDVEEYALFLEAVGALKEVEGARVVATTCGRGDAFPEEWSRIELGPLRVEDARLWVEKTVGPGQEEGLIQLCQTVHCHPLSIQLLLGYLGGQGKLGLRGSAAACIQEYSQVAQESVRLGSVGRAVMLSTKGLLAGHGKKGQRALDLLCLLALTNSTGIDLVAELLSLSEAKRWG